MREWFQLWELVGLPDMPGTKRAVEIRAKKAGWANEKNTAGEPLCRPRKGCGGGCEYHVSLLPDGAVVALRLREEAVSEKRQRSRPTADWVWFEGLSRKKKEVAHARAAALNGVDTLVRKGVRKQDAVSLIASHEKVGTSTIYAWLDLVAGIAREDWLPALAPHYTGRAATAACDPTAWKMIKADYLRAERPTFESCYRRLERAAAGHGWTIPSMKTLRRRLECELSAGAITKARHGTDALKRMYPAQERDRSVFHALEAVNSDGHKWDVFVRWPDGEIGRPCMVAIQDLYSGTILAYRIDKTENAAAVRLAFGDLVEDWGIPFHAYLDNGRNFAAKWVTGGTETRYRFKVRDEEPAGILTSLGVEVHWTTPYSGQSKPIERAFLDFCDNIAKHPAFAGAWTGNSPVNKPANYGSKAIDLDNFLAVVADGIVEHNTRPGRRARVCAGRFLMEAFDESYARSPVKKATDAQRRLWLLAAEGVRASKRDGVVRLLGNRYWADFLHGHMGQPLVVRFDPDILHAGVHVYRLDGSYVGFAECIETAGFNDVDAARAHSRARRQWMKAQRAMLDAARTMTPADVADLIPAMDAAPPTEAFARWAIRYRPWLDDDDRDYLERLLRSKAFRMLLGIEPIEEKESRTG